jgi:hypothetical protein
LTTSSLVYLYQERAVAPGKTAAYLAELTHKNVTLPASGASSFWATRLSEAQSITLPPPSDAPLLMGALPPATGGTDALSAVKSLLLTAAIVALVSSQAYAAARALARWLLIRLEWDGSIAHQLVRRRDLELKRAWLDEHNIRLSPKEMTRRALGWAEKTKENDTDDDHDESDKAAASGSLQEGLVGCGSEHGSAVLAAGGRRKAPRAHQRQNRVDSPTQTLRPIVDKAEFCTSLRRNCTTRKACKSATPGF